VRRVDTLRIPTEFRPYILVAGIEQKPQGISQPSRSFKRRCRVTRLDRAWQVRRTNISKPKSVLIQRAAGGGVRSPGNHRSFYNAYEASPPRGVQQQQQQQELQQKQQHYQHYQPPQQQQQQEQQKQQQQEQQKQQQQEQQKQQQQQQQQGQHLLSQSRVDNPPSTFAQQQKADFQSISAPSPLRPSTASQPVQQSHRSLSMHDCHSGCM
jgi:hypothetical protein